MQPPSKTALISSLSNVKRLLQLTELQLANSLGKDSSALVLCVTACSNSLVSNSLLNRLVLHDKAMKITVKGINNGEVIDTKLVELTVKPHDNKSFEPFKASPHVKKNLNVGADITIIKHFKKDIFL